MEIIKLTLTVDEANLILTALGQQPYIKVASLIQKIQSQGATQLQGNSADEVPASTPVTTKSPARASNGK